MTGVAAGSPPAAHVPGCCHRTAALPPPCSREQTLTRGADVEVQHKPCSCSAAVWARAQAVLSLVPLTWAAAPWERGSAGYGAALSVLCPWFSRAAGDGLQATPTCSVRAVIESQISLC